MNTVSVIWSEALPKVVETTICCEACGEEMTVAHFEGDILDFDTARRGALNTHVCKYRTSQVTDRYADLAVAYALQRGHPDWVEADL